MEYLEPYLKDNNLLQLPVFYFGNRGVVCKKKVTKWEDDSGEYSLKCVCDYGTPGALEQDVYTAIMRIWVKNGMKDKTIKVNYSQIAREMGLKPTSWTGKIKKSLEKLAQARYEFSECFIVADEEGNKRISTHFSLFNKVVLFNKNKNNSRRNSESVLEFPDDILKNIESKYYQFLDMAWYRALPAGLPRRMYEFLAKRKYHSIGGVFIISEVAICRWLPIKDEHTTNRRKRLKKTANALIEAGYLLSYNIDTKKKQCYFEYAKEKEEKEVITVETSPPKKETKLIPESTELERLVSLLRLKRVPKATKNTLAKHLGESGSDYVERNILYANEKAKSSYSNYLGKCLDNDYAETWSEEKEQKQDTLFDLNEELKKKHEEEEEKKKREAALDKLRIDFLDKAGDLSDLFKNMAFDSAEKEVENNPAKDFAIKPAYAEKVRSIINDTGGSFPKEVLSMDILKKVWEKKPK